MEGSSGPMSFLSGGYLWYHVPSGGWLCPVGWVSDPQAWDFTGLGTTQTCSRQVGSVHLTGMLPCFKFGLAE